MHGGVQGGEYADLSGHCRVVFRQRRPSPSMMSPRREEQQSTCGVSDSALLEEVQHVLAVLPSRSTFVARRVAPSSLATNGDERRRAGSRGPDRVLPTLAWAPVAAASLLPAMGLRAMGMPVAADSSGLPLHSLDSPRSLHPHAVVLTTSQQDPEGLRHLWGLAFAIQLLDLEKALLLGTTHRTLVRGSASHRVATHVADIDGRCRQVFARLEGLERIRIQAMVHLLDRVG